MRALTLLVLLVALLGMEGDAYGQPRVPGVSNEESWDVSDPRSNHVQREGRLVIRGEVLVGLNDGGFVGQIETQVRARGGRIVGSIPRLRVLRIAIPDSLNEIDEALAYGRIPGVAYASTNDVCHVASGGQRPAEPVPPNDEFFDKQWDLLNVGQLGGTPGADIDILGAWQLQTGSASIVTAVLDTGIDYAHPDLQGRLLPGHDFVEEDDDPSSEDEHGTEVAGRIAANVDNSIALAGVDKRGLVLPIRVITAAGGSAFDVAQGLDYAAASSASIINLSLGNFTKPDVMEVSLLAARKAGKILVAAAGNGNPKTSWPGASNQTISVTASQYLDGSLGQDGTPIDFIAPGIFVPVLMIHSTETQLDAGTSFAAPQLAGVISLMKAENPYLSQTNAYRALLAGADDQVGPASGDTPGWDPQYGHGRLNASGALAALCSSTTRLPLLASPPRLSVVDGGVFVLNIDAGPDCAGDPYWLLGSFSGSEPGTTIGQAHFPLNLDNYLRFCVLYPNTEPISGNQGTLDASGRARVTVTVPPGLPGAADLTLHHAVAIFDGRLIRSLAGPPKFVTEATVSNVGAAPRILFKDAFQAGAMTWSLSGPAGALWHLTSDGECGAAGQMVAFTLPEFGCDCTALGKLTTTAISPSFVLSGEWPYRISFDQIRDIDDSGKQSATTLRIVEESGFLEPLELTDRELEVGLPGELTHIDLEIPGSSKLVGRTVHLEVEASVKAMSLPGKGWLLDNLAVRNDGDS
jgi:subtilisin family serine protease